MSELPNIASRQETQARPGKFAGLAAGYALERAKELLDHEVVTAYLEPYLARGALAEDIARETQQTEEQVLQTLEQLEELLAIEHLQHSFGHSAQILELINKAEAATR